MTLQEFKEQVAQEYGYENFEDMYSDMIHIGDEDNLLKEMDRAAELYAKQEFDEGYSCGANNAAH